MSEKIYLRAQDLLEDSFKLGHMIYESGFRPTFMIAVWRGGVPIGIAVQEYLAARGVATDHIAIRTGSYTGIDTRSRVVEVHGLSYLIKNINAEDRLLIVDDVFDTGHTIVRILEELRAQVRLNMPEEVRVAVPWYKPTRSLVDLTPDYFIHETDQWLKYPHSLEGLTFDEIRANRPEIWAIIGEALLARDAAGQA